MSSVIVTSTPAMATKGHPATVSLSMKHPSLSDSAEYTEIEDSGAPRNGKLSMKFIEKDVHEYSGLDLLRLATTSSAQKVSQLGDNQQAGRITRGPNYYLGGDQRGKSNCPVRQSNNHTSAIRLKRVSNTNAPITDADCIQQNQYQLQYQDEFNKKRERLFRLLSKVPIHVGTVSSELYHQTGAAYGSSTAKHQVIDREPLIIKYYNERSLMDMLELHFGCSLLKHNYERQLSLEIHLPSDGAGSSGYTQPHYSCSNPMALSTQSYTPDSTIQSSTNNHQGLRNQQQLQEDDQRITYGVQWQHQTIQQQPLSGGCSFQWQIQPCGLPEKVKKPSGSCADSRLGSSFSSNRRSSTTSDVVKGTINQRQSQKKPLPGNGAGGKVRQRRPVKQQLITRSEGSGGGSHGSQDTISPPSTSSSSRTDIASPSINASAIYHQQNGKVGCYARAKLEPSSETHYAGERFANQLQSASNTTFNHGPFNTDAHSTVYNTTNHHQQTDHNQSIHLHLYTQPTTYQQTDPHHTNGMILPVDGASQAPQLIATHFNIQPTMVEQDNSRSALVFRPQIDHNNIHQIMYEQHNLENGNPIAIESAQLLQQSQNHQLGPILSNEQPPTSGVQYYTTAASHPQAPGDYQQHAQSQLCDSQATSSWQSQMCPLSSEQLNELPHQQQMIEQQQISGIICDNYVRNRDCYANANNYSVLYTNGRQQQHAEVQLQVADGMSFIAHRQQEQLPSGHPS